MNSGVGRGRTKTGFLWALTRDEQGWGGDDPHGVVFTYHLSHAGGSCPETSKRQAEPRRGADAAY